MYGSHLSKWRHQRDAVELARLSPQKRGQKADPHAHKLNRLRQQVGQLNQKLARAELIMAAPKNWPTCLSCQSARRLSRTNDPGRCIGNTELVCVLPVTSSGCPGARISAVVPSQCSQDWQLRISGLTVDNGTSADLLARLEPGRATDRSRSPQPHGAGFADTSHRACRSNPCRPARRQSGRCQG